MELIKELMGLGILVEPDAVEKLQGLNEEQLKLIVERSKQDRPLVMTDKIIDSFLKTTTFKVLKTIEKKKSFSVQDIVDMLNKRYDFIQSLLMRKIEMSNIVSINKCANGKLTVIGMVKNKERSNGNFVLELEDKTGSLKTVVSADIGKKVELDDVIGVHGNYNNKLLFGEKIIYPDAPLRKVNYSEKDTKVAFIINHDFSEEIEIDADYIFIGNCDNTEKAKHHDPRSKIFLINDEKEGLYYIQSPALIDIDGIIILVLFDHDPLDVIKKRFITSENNDFLIDKIPDIILTNKDINTNYKGITIIGNSSIIELNTRNVSKL